VLNSLENGFVAQIKSIQAFEDIKLDKSGS